jgi:ABC-type multidrug transport system ATPase subunit
VLHALGGQLKPSILLEVWDYPGVQGVLGKEKFEIGEGTTAFVEGPSGAGKTRLFRRIVDLDPEPVGTIIFEGQNVREYPLPDLRRKILFVPQEPPRLMGTAKDVLKTLLLGSDDPIAERREDELVKKLDLQGTLDRSTSQLSGGEWKRLILVAALSKNPTILLLDEPFVGLDDARVEDAAEAIHNRVTKGLTILWTSHQKTVGPLKPDQTLRIFKPCP